MQRVAGGKRESGRGLPFVSFGSVPPEQAMEVPARRKTGRRRVAGDEIGRSHVSKASGRLPSQGIWRLLPHHCRIRAHAGRPTVVKQRAEMTEAAGCGDGSAQLHRDSGADVERCVWFRLRQVFCLLLLKRAALTGPQRARSGAGGAHRRRLRSGLEWSG